MGTDKVRNLYKGMGTISLLMATLVQSLALFSAMYFIENTTSKKRAELLKYENDPAVEEAGSNDLVESSIVSEIELGDYVSWNGMLLLVLWSSFIDVFCAVRDDRQHQRKTEWESHECHHWRIQKLAEKLSNSQGKTRLLYWMDYKRTRDHHVYTEDDFWVLGEECYEGTGKSNG